jgi:hypothetical protein
LGTKKKREAVTVFGDQLQNQGIQWKSCPGPAEDNDPKLLIETFVMDS